MQAYYVILYYHYAKIDDLETFSEEHHKFCDNNRL